MDIDDPTNTLDSKQYTCIVFCDISKAFDRVLHKCLLFNPIALRKAKIVYNFGLSGCNRVNLEQNVIKGSLLKWISQYLLGRSQSGKDIQQYGHANYIFTAISVEVIITNKLNIPKMMKL